jgi:hypothetical protein
MYNARTVFSTKFETELSINGLNIVSLKQRNRNQLRRNREVVRKDCDPVTRSTHSQMPSGEFVGTDKVIEARLVPRQEGRKLAKSCND